MIFAPLIISHRRQQALTAPVESSIVSHTQDDEILLGPADLAGQCRFITETRET